jgi:RND family efflux transporter MFP subunit
MRPAASSRFRTAGVVLTVLVLAAVAVMKSVQLRALGREGAARKAAVDAGPMVRSQVVGADAAGSTLSFPGETLPWASTTLYGKVAGFIKDIRVDKGSRVRQGEVLAIVQSPETEKQTLALKSSYENLEVIARRYAELGRQGVASAQDVDNARSAAQVARQTWLSQATMEGYEKVVAPFSGVVTERMVDPGAFIQNASGSLSAQPILTLSDLSRLRVTFFVDQDTAALVRAGQEVTVSPADRPDQESHGRISRVAGTLDVHTRTMLAEADLDNRDGRFLGGGYVRVALRLPGAAARLELPADALLMRGAQPFAAVLEAGRVHLAPLVLGADAGSQVRVLQGLAAGSRVVLNPSPGLRDGDRVRAE